MVLAVVLAAAGLPVLGVVGPAVAAVPPPGTPAPLNVSYSYQTMRGGGLIDEPNTPTSPSVGPIPVTLATGNLWLSETDLVLPGRGVPAHVGRTYNAEGIWLDGRFGYGWTASTATLRINGYDYMPDLYDENGNIIHFAYDSGAHAYVSRWNQRMVVDGDGNFVLTRHDQTKLTFSPAVYLGPTGKLLSMVDENGAGVTMTYSGELLTSITDVAGRKLTFTYTGIHVQKVTDPAGRSVSYEYDGSSNLVAVHDLGGQITRYGYDDAHHLTSVSTPRGGVSKVVYATIAGFPQVTSQTDPLGHLTKYAYTAANWSPTHPCPNDQVKVTTPAGVLYTDTFTNCAMIQHWIGNSAWSYSYDSLLRGISKVVDPNLHTTTMTFDGNGNTASNTDALGNVTKATYSGTNKVLTTTDPLGHVTTKAYDAKGNLTKVTRGTSITSYAYADTNHPGDLTSITDPEAKVWRYGYDTYGMRATVTDPLGNIGRQAFDAVGRQVSSTAPSGAITKFTVDATGRVTSVTDPLGRITRTEYDADYNIVKLTEPSGTVTTTAYDLDDRATSVTAGVGTASARTTKTSYTADGKVLTQTDGLGHVTTYGYDAYGRPATVTDPLGRKTTTTYDAAYNPATVVDPSGRTTTFTYDADDRPLTTKYSDGVTKGITSTTYDAAGRRTAMTDGTGTITYTYDDLNRLTARRDGGARVVGYAYDRRGLLTGLTYPGGVNTVTRGYDAAGRLTSVKDWLGHTNSFAYDANANLVTTTLGNGDVIRAAFDDTDRSTVLTLLDGSATLKRLGYTRDSGGMITAEDAKAYVYDPTHRLTSAEGTALGYDAADRRTSTGATTFGYDIADELLTSVTSGATTTYTYDKQGNRIKRTAPSGVTGYGFDQAGRLTSLDNDQYGHHTFGYDGDGLRVSKYIGGNGLTQTYTWNIVGGLPTMLTDGSYTYVTGPGGLPLEQIAGTTALYYFHDQLGSTRVLSNQDGSVNTSYEYTADGVLKSRVGSASNPFQFAGQYWDSTTGLYAMRARYYDPAAAQFISRDPMVATTGQPYVYANDNPVNLTDPSGLYVPGTNGCGAEGGLSHYLVPNLSFGGACDMHDFCYGSGLSKGFCDGQFLRNMQAVCSGDGCRALAWLYYKAVDKFGSGAYNAGAKEGADDLAKQVAACGGNTECITKAEDDAEFDEVMNRMYACQDDKMCEESIRDSHPDRPASLDGDQDWEQDAEWESDSDWDFDWDFDFDFDWGGGGGGGGCCTYPVDQY
jgi:RHS repeat-associated protein